MKNDFDNLMNLYNQKKDEHIQRCKNLQEEYSVKQQEQSQKLENIQSQMSEFKELEEEKKKLNDINSQIKMKAHEYL